MKVGIYGKKFDKLNENAVVELISRLEQASIEIAIYEPFYDLIKAKIKLSKEVSLFSASRHIVNKIDFLFNIVFNVECVFFPIIKFPLIRDDWRN